MDTIVKQRAEAWLTGSYDEETKAQVKALTENNPKELEESSAPADCAVSWAWAPIA